VLDGKIDKLIIVAAPRTLGELRKHYHKALTAVLVGEIAKDLTGHTVSDVERTIAAA
jgi:protein required for attachment to host cells